jgi:hypothetical protein
MSERSGITKMQAAKPRLQKLFNLAAATKHQK